MFAFYSFPNYDPEVDNEAIFPKSLFLLREDVVILITVVIATITIIVIIVIVITAFVLLLQPLLERMD